jgi:hypothetical protein
MRAPDAFKPSKGFKGAGVLEVVEDHDGDTTEAGGTWPSSSLVGCLAIDALFKLHRIG